MHGHNAPHPHAHDSADTKTPAAVPAEAAADLIRQKLERIFAEAPDTRQEIATAETAAPSRSVHQAFIQRLAQSGKSLAQIQTEWHHYYSQLPDDQKHAVWQEFHNHQNTSFRPHQPPHQTTTTQSAITNPVTTQPQVDPAGPAASQTSPPEQPTLPAGVYPEPTQPLHDRDPLHPANRLTEATATHAPGDNSRNNNPAILASNQEQELYQSDDRHPDEIKQQLLQQINRRAKLKPRHHIQSLLFGLGCGGLALLIVLFSFFNEMFLAPFVQPSRKVNATPIILGVDGVAPSDKAEVIIPKINVQIPLNFSAKTIKEDDIQLALESGVAHYPTTPRPGQTGNTAFFGHSSNNIFNPGQYKFAFVLLRELIPGDTFYLTRDGVAYAYQVFDKKIVEPDAVEVLNPIPGKSATATLITCDPPGTTIKRLAIIGEQVNPNPSSNSVGQTTPVGNQPASQADSQEKTTLPGNAPSLWHRLTAWARDDS